MADPFPQGHAPLWRRYPSLAAAAGAVLLLIAGAAALAWHVTATSDPSSAHVAAGDFVFFGMVAGLVVLVTGLTIARARREPPGERPDS